MVSLGFSWHPRLHVVRTVVRNMFLICVYFIDFVHFCICYIFVADVVTHICVDVIYVYEFLNFVYFLEVAVFRLLQHPIA